MKDLIIIGAGPAGLTAGLYAARKEMNALILTKEFGGQPMWTSGVENYMGFQMITGPELMMKFNEQIQQFPLEIKYEEALEITHEKNDNGFNFFKVRTSSETYESKTVIIATGKRPRKLNVPGEEKFIGRGVAFCATCDGPFYKGKKVAVVGGGNSAVQAALELSRIASEVYLIVRKDYAADPILVRRLEESKQIKILVNSQITEIQGEDAVSTIFVKNTETESIVEIQIDGIFIEIGLDSNSEFVKPLLELNSSNEILIGMNCETSIAGLWAAGDVTEIYQNQIIIAAGEGAKASLGAFEYLMRMDKNE